MDPQDPKQDLDLTDWRLGSSIAIVRSACIRRGLKSKLGAQGGLKHDNCRQQLTISPTSHVTWSHDAQPNQSALWVGRRLEAMHDTWSQTGLRCSPIVDRLTTSRSLNENTFHSHVVKSTSWDHGPNCSTALQLHSEQQQNQTQETPSTTNHYTVWVAFHQS